MRQLGFILAIGLLVMACGKDDKESLVAKMEKAQNVAIEKANEAIEKANEAIDEATEATTTSTATIKIKVNSKKENGKKWDAFGGKPDIAVCINNGDKTTCYPSAGGIGDITKPHCKNTFNCTLSNVPVTPGEDLEIEIIDVDASANDDIGDGDCSFGQSRCSLGQATVTINWPKAAGTAKLANSGKKMTALEKRMAESKARIEARMAESKARIEKRMAESKARIEARMAGKPVPAAAKSAGADAAAAAAPAKASSTASSGPGSYPASCDGLDMKHHTKIQGAEGNQCVANNLLALTEAGVFEHRFTGSPSSYSDGNEFAILGSPQKKADETSSLTGKERGGLAKKTRSNIYWKAKANNGCSLTYTDAVGKLSVSCEWSDLYVSGSPFVKKKVKCEYEPGCTVDECSDHDDCSGWTCGCDRSRCTIWGRCTRCPGEKICDDPEFNLKGVKPWKISKKFKSDEDKAIAKAMAKTYSKNGVLLFKVKSHYRKLFYGREDGETTVDHDSGYLLKIQPLALVFRNKKTGDVLTLFSKGDIKTTYDKRWTFKNSYSNRNKSSSSVAVNSTITCKGGVCTAKAAK